MNAPHAVTQCSRSEADRPASYELLTSMERSFCRSSVAPLLSTGALMPLLPSNKDWQTRPDVFRPVRRRLQRASASDGSVCTTNPRQIEPTEFELNWVFRSPVTVYCRNRNSHISKVAHLLPVFLRKTRRWTNHNSGSFASSSSSSSSSSFIRSVKIKQSCTAMQYSGKETVNSV